MHVDTGTMAQWAAVAVSLTMGVRSEVRAYRSGSQDFAKKRANAVALLIALFRQLDGVLPMTPAEADSVLIDQRRDELKRLAELCHENVGDIAATSTNAAMNLLELSDRLHELAVWPRVAVEDRAYSHKLLLDLASTHTTLQKLAIIVGWRKAIRGDYVSSNDLNQDRYHNQFRTAYENFRDEARRIRNLSGS